MYYLLDIEKDPFSLVNKSRSLELTESIEEVEYSPGEQSRHSFIMNNNIYHDPNTYFQTKNFQKKTLITMASSFLTKLFGFWITFGQQKAKKNLAQN